MIRRYGTIRAYSSLAVLAGFLANHEAAMARDSVDPSIAFQQMLTGGIVNTPEIALKLAELVIIHVYGNSELERQKPLRISDELERWLVEGSYNSERTAEGPSQVIVRIKKIDGQITDLRHIHIIIPLPSIEDILNSSK